MLPRTGRAGKERNRGETMRGKDSSVQELKNHLYKHKQKQERNKIEVDKKQIGSEKE